MTTVANDLSVPALGGRYHFLLRRLHSLTGILFGLYVIVHLVINATLVQGGLVFKTQVQKIHSLPFLTVIEWTFLFLPLIYHTLYGLWITVTGQWNAPSYSYGRNWFYVLQRITAVVLILFVGFHVLSLKYGLFGPNLVFDPDYPTRTVATHMQFSRFVAWIVYPVGILAASFHLANGFWAAGVTWGLTISANAQRRWGLVCIGLFALAFGAGMVALLAALRVNLNIINLH